jgi:putative flavoprotein involved in K+ transport
VVGSGNSGAAIAAELTSTHAVDLSVRSKLRFHGRHGWKKAVPYLARGSRAVYAKYTSPIGRQVRRFGIPIIGTELKQALESGKVTLRPAATSLSGGTVGFSDGSKGEYAAVIWCTGFRSSLGWIDIPGAVNPNGSPAHQFGISPVPGLYYLGLHWQRSLASALIGGVAKDARFIVQTARQHLAP